MTTEDQAAPGDRGHGSPMTLRQRAWYSPAPLRPTVTLPDRARLAVWVAINLEHYEYEPAFVGERDPWPRTPHPDVQQYTYRDFGNRVGIWRILDVLDEFGLPFTVSLNSGVLALYPELAEMIAGRDCAVMAHGRFNTEYVNRLSETDEREWLTEMAATIREATGKEVRGTLGPGVSATVNTPDLLAELGMTYQADWVLDDQPAPIAVRSGRLISIPYTFELNDARMIGDATSAADFEDACLRQFDVLYEEGASGARVMCIALHTFISGQPHMPDVLRRIFTEMRRREDVWFTTADEIAGWFMASHYDEQRAFASQEPAHRAGEAR